MGKQHPLMGIPVDQGAPFYLQSGHVALKLADMGVARQRVPVEVCFRKGGFALLESYHDEGFLMDPRADPFAKVLVLIGGEGTLYRGGEAVAIRAPSLLVIPQLEQHRIEDHPGKPLSLAGLCFMPACLVGQEIREGACGRWRLEADTPLLRRVRESLREIMVEERQRQTGAAEVQASLVSRILVELARSPGQMEGTGQIDSRRRVEGYATVLERQFWKADDLDSVSSSLGLSRRRFTQLFREVTGESWLERVNRLRLEYARDLIRATPLSVQSIAFECGFSDISHFYRAFKGHFGNSPGAFRAQRS